MEWHKLLEGEAEEWCFLLEEEFGGTEMTALEQAWQELQSVPSYIERYAQRDEELSMDDVDALETALAEPTLGPYTLDQLKALIGIEQEPYTTELAFRLKLGNAFFYYHQECGKPDHQYTNVDRYYLAIDAICMGCHGLLSEAPVLE